MCLYPFAHLLLCMEHVCNMGLPSLSLLGKCVSLVASKFGQFVRSCQSCHLSFSFAGSLLISYAYPPPLPVVVVLLRRSSLRIWMMLVFRLSVGVTERLWRMSNFQDTSLTYFSQVSNRKLPYRSIKSWGEKISSIESNNTGSFSQVVSKERGCG